VVARLLPFRYVALRSTKNASDSPVDAEELLEQLEKLMDRLKVMYEQYFLGIQKLAPAQLHSEAERRLRDLTQVQLRNTALRYRFNSIQQKYGSYNSYWRRTLREIEQGKYVRTLQRLSQKAARDGVDLPEEILAAMPKRMREQVLRDRQAAVSLAKLRSDEKRGAGSDIDGDSKTSAPVAAPGKRDARGNFLLTEDDGDLDLDSLFSEMADEKTEPVRTSRPPTRPAPLPRATTQSGPGSPSARAPSIPSVQRPPIPSVPRPTAPAVAPATRPARAATEQGTGPARSSALSATAVGMTDAEVRNLYNNYVKARELVGEKSDASTYAKLIKTIQQQAPKIMEQYKSKGVEFGVVVKGNQVILKAKPK
jgi:hypothetical protein